jgi:Fic family protein
MRIKESVRSIGHLKLILNKEKIRMSQLQQQERRITIVERINELQQRYEHLQTNAKVHEDQARAYREDALRIEGAVLELRALRIDEPPAKGVDVVTNLQVKKTESENQDGSSAEVLDNAPTEMAKNAINV